MNDIPKPSGYDVYWEKWIDAFDVEEEQFEEDIAEIEQVLTREELLEQENIFQSISHIRSIVTPFGVLPLTEQTMASKYFKFWVGHSNFKLTEAFYKIIGQHPGIETLDILTPYRFRIAVGKMFVDRDVMTSVRDEMVRYVATTKLSDSTTDTTPNVD
jgi:hypothetical protein